MLGFRFKYETKSFKRVFTCPFALLFPLKVKIYPFSFLIPVVNGFVTIQFVPP